MCLNAESLIICLIPGFLFFIRASPSRCPHANGSTWGRPAAAYPARGHIKTIPRPLSRNSLSWLKGTKFLRHSLFLPPHCVQSLKTRLSERQHQWWFCYRFKRFCGGSNLCLLSLCFPQTQFPKMVKMCFKDTHLNFYFHGEMPSNLITIITLNHQRHVIWQLRGENLSRKDLLTFHIDKLGRNNHALLKKMEVSRNIFRWASCVWK